MTQAEFTTTMASITGRIGGRSLDKSLEADLNRLVPSDGPLFQSIAAGCRAGVAAGWMCSREAGGIKYGRVVKASEATHGFSVDVVEMENIAGPHHRHPNGEIDLIMPLSEQATFDGRGPGWLVYGPDSAHSPTVAGGRALVLYLLPQGAIEFSKASSTT
jgi:hypothetical protein